MMSLSVVIPTYNRPDQLSLVIDHLLLSEVDDFSDVEVIVVDDGSTADCRSVIEGKRVESPFRLKYVRQENAGPAVARNLGTLEATHELVLLIDDDVLVTPGLIRAHFEAHAVNPGAIIHGPYPYRPMEEETTAFRFLNSLIAPADSKGGEPNDYERVVVVASGNLSFEKSTFGQSEMYEKNLKIPAAEEFELEHRLNRLRIPIVSARKALAWHLQPPTIEDKCKQEFKYGIGAAEVWVKVPGIMENEHISRFILENGYISASDTMASGLKKSIKSVLGKPVIREALLRMVKLAEQVSRSEALLFPLYRLICGIYLFAGVRNGLVMFGQVDRADGKS